VSGCHSGSEGAAGASLAGKHVLIIVQNLPVPLDRRVWLECVTLAPGVRRSAAWNQSFPPQRAGRGDGHDGRPGRSAA
jgi:hypothetical protein